LSARAEFHPLTTLVINAWGTQQTLEHLQTTYQAAYLSSPRQNFTDTDGKVVGWTQSAGKGAGNVAFVSFRNAGHMVRLSLCAQKSRN
jgi:cathepsin A (carboxypeptidase C)